MKAKLLFLFVGLLMVGCGESSSPTGQVDGTDIVSEKQAIESKVLQALVALTLLWVWLFRFGRPTSFRGGRSKDLKEEFSVYGLPEWSFWAVGSCKVLLSLFLLAGLYFEQLVKPTALALSVFMFAAVWMHLKMKRDSLVKALPAYLMLTACVFLVFN